MVLSVTYEKVKSKIQQAIERVAERNGMYPVNVISVFNELTSELKTLAEDMEATGIEKAEAWEVFELLFDEIQNCMSG